MFRINKSKSAIGVIAFVLLVTLTPPAIAGKPGTIPSLNGSICKAFGGVWKAGKNGKCTVINTTGNSNRFLINAGDTLEISNGGIFNVNFDIDNSGNVNNNGTFNTLTGDYYNSSAGVFNNNGIFNNNLTIYNGAIFNNHGNFNNTSRLINYITFNNYSDGIINNTTGGSIDNRGTFTNISANFFVDGTNNFFNAGTIYNRVNAIFNNSDGYINNNGGNIVNENGTWNGCGISVGGTGSGLPC